MLRSCPSGHGLSKERNHEAQLRCDGVCGTAVEQDAWLWSCTKCDFDLCVTCGASVEIKPGMAWVPARPQRLKLGVEADRSSGQPTAWR